MGYERITVKPIGGEIGAEIKGVDLNNALDDQTYQEIKQAWLEHLVLVFRNQDITPDRQVEFGRRWGDLHVHPFIPSLEGYPEIIKLHAESGEREELRLSNQWHVDLSYTYDPPLAAILRGVTIPERGGDTMWCNLYRAYETLSDEMKKIVEGLTAYHDVTKTYRREELQRDGGPERYGQTFKNAPPVEQPIVQVHPETGRKLLYLSELTTTHIKDLHPNESDALLNMLFEHINWKELQFRLYWEKNTIAMWDNRCTVHYAVRNYTEEREMHRVTVLGKTFN